MTNLFSRSRTTAVFVIVCLFISSCQPSTSNSLGQTHTADENVAFGPGDFLLPDPKVGLADLSSYRATLILSFDGTRDGKANHWSITYVLLTEKDPASRQLTIAKTGNLADLSAVFMAETDGVTYERLGNNACTAAVIEQGNTLEQWLEPAGFLTGIHGAEAAGNDPINGMPMDHYTFDERALGQVDIAVSTGEIWVSPEAGYIVKYKLMTAGNADYFGNGIDGTLTWNYELTDINQSVAIQLPGDCPAGMVNAPVLPDASNIQNVPGLLTYNTTSSSADVTAFYQERIADMGWMLLGDPAINDTLTLLEFTLGKQMMTVIITAGEGDTKVLVELSSVQGATPAP
jgi:hypothetical protein